MVRGPIKIVGTQTRIRYFPDSLRGRSDWIVCAHGNHVNLKSSKRCQQPKNKRAQLPSHDSLAHSVHMTATTDDVAVQSEKMMQLERQIEPAGVEEKNIIRRCQLSPSGIRVVRSRKKTYKSPGIGWRQRKTLIRKTTKEKKKTRNHHRNRFHVRSRRWFFGFFRGESRAPV